MAISATPREPISSFIGARSSPPKASPRPPLGFGLGGGTGLAEIAEETEISDAETLRTKAALSCVLPGLETGARLRKAATPRHFPRQPGKSPFGGTAWWAREDSNLQPDRYERPALTIELRAPGWQRKSERAGAPLLATLAARPQIDAGALPRRDTPRRVLRNGARFPRIARDVVLTLGSTLVIPGRREAASPKPVAPSVSMGSGLPRCARPPE